jgi:hypothetical protein
MLAASLVLLAFSIGLYAFMVDRLLRIGPPVRARIVGTPLRIFMLGNVRFITSGAAYAGVWYSTGPWAAAAVYVTAWAVRTVIRDRIRKKWTENLVAEMIEWDRERKGTLSDADLANIRAAVTETMRSRMRGEGKKRGATARLRRVVEHAMERLG